MDPKETSQESGNAGKPGETTAAAGAAQSATVDPKNLTPAGVASLLDSAFAESAGPPPAAGQEVQPVAKSGGDKHTPPKGDTAEPQWTADQTAWFELRAQAVTPAEIAAADAQAPEFSETERAWIERQQSDGSDKSDQSALPPEVLNQVKAWEDTGGALPAALQAIVDKRIGREVGKVKELETRATRAESEVQRLTTELETRTAERGTAAAGAYDEKSLTALVNASKTFQADARAFLGGYADATQTARLEKHMTATGQDDNALRRQLDEVNDWLTQEVPVLRQRVQAFRQQEAQIAPVMQARFPSLEQKDGEDAKFAAEVLRFVPDLAQRTPAHKLALGMYALGRVAWEHLTKASAEGDVIEALKGVLTAHVPLPTNGNGKGKFFLPGKAPRKTAPAGGAFTAPRAEANQARETAASEELRKNPTAENVTESLRIALR